eukprot:m.287804 g.287804  ORF g.287804 m.287804 type:complete len:210 (+) comp40705_c0_seq4:240-869(+)
MASFGSDEYHDYMGGDVLSTSAVQVLVFIAECPTTRPSLLLPSVVDAVVAVVEDGNPYRNVHVLCSYLVCLLLCEDVWPSTRSSKEEVAKKVIGQTLRHFLYGWTKIRYCRYQRNILYTSMLPVFQIAKCQDIVEVAVFGLWYFTSLCSIEFTSQTNERPCPICLIKKEDINIDDLRSVEVPADFEYLKIDLDAVADQCNGHDGYHLPS